MRRMVPLEGGIPFVSAASAVEVGASSVRGSEVECPFVRPLVAIVKRADHVLRVGEVIRIEGLCDCLGRKAEGGNSELLSVLVVLLCSSTFLRVVERQSDLTNPRHMHMPYM